ncbi:hypothetical protein J6590_025327 [Homalodisca vitripennis]|nr:hypothetical protein J6590_025327 [Homalodisca vitripennis]
MQNTAPRILDEHTGQHYSGIISGRSLADDKVRQDVGSCEIPSEDCPAPFLGVALKKMENLTSLGVFSPEEVDSFKQKDLRWDSWSLRPSPLGLCPFPTGSLELLLTFCDLFFLRFLPQTKLSATTSGPKVLRFLSQRKVGGGRRLF